MLVVCTYPGRNLFPIARKLDGAGGGGDVEGTIMKYLGESTTHSLSQL